MDSPGFSSYIFVWLGLVISSLYNRTKVILMAAAYTLLLTFITFTTYQDQFFSNNQPADIAYILLFTLFVSVFLIFQSNFTEQVWHGLNESQEKLKYILESANIITYSYNPISGIHTVSSGMKALENFSKTEKSSSPVLWKSLIHPDDLPFISKVEQEIYQGKTMAVEYRIQFSKTNIMWVAAKFFPVMSEQEPMLERIEGALVDITDRKKAEEKIEFLAYHDPLTKLPNRSQLYQYVHDQQRNRTFDYEKAFIIFLDLDSFKQINDTYGHQTGDQLLSLAAERLTRSLKKKDMVSRIGGDEFVAFINGLTIDEAIQVAERLQGALCSPFIVDGESISITPSIGISKFTSVDEDLDTLISQADAAMYNIKNEGKNGIKLYHYS